MPPVLALILWFILLLALFRFDPAKEPDTSFVLWIPLTWMFIVGSRLPSQWLGFTSSGVAAQELQEGNPMDRTIFSLLIVMSIVVLTQRSFDWSRFVYRNTVLVAFLLFGLASMFWSDFPFIAFKRWFRDLGNYFVILVVASDPRPLEAISTLMRRVGYLLIPLSILIFKYYPQIGRQYDQWTGVPMFVGATTSKNMLGVLCLVSGIFFFWDTVRRWAARRDGRTKRIIQVNVAFLAMSLWVLNLANSATSSVCLALGCLVVVAVHSRWGAAHAGFLKFVIPASFFLYLILGYGLGVNATLAGALGRDPTFTGRTNIWQAVLSTKTNPLVGAGYESFWLGPRLKQVWSLAGGVNEAHNGYLEVYLELGIVGVFLLFMFLIGSYRTICRKLSPSFSLASLGLALCTIVLFYNVTESAAFRGQFLWLVFLLVVVTVGSDAPVKHEAAPKKASSERFFGQGIKRASQSAAEALNQSYTRGR